MELLNETVLRYILMALLTALCYSVYRVIKNKANQYDRKS